MQDEPIISIIAGSLMLNMDMDGQIKEGFYADNEEIAQLINFHIQARTPIRTGALVSAEKYEVNHDPSSEDLVVFYADDAEQLAEWKRVYVAYQEGGAYGLPTYTNPPHEMYAKVETEDADLIQAWGYATLDKSINDIASQVGSI